QGGTEHQHGGRFPHQRAAVLDPPGPNRLTEGHHVRFEDTAADGARHHREVLELFVGEVGVTVRVDHGRHRVEPGVGLLQTCGQFVPAAEGTAGEADDPVQDAVEFHDVVAAGARVPTVEVLRDHAVEQTVSGERGYAPVPGVWAGPDEGAPAEAAAGPLQPPCPGPGHDVLVRHRVV